MHNTSQVIFYCLPRAKEDLLKILYKWEFLWKAARNAAHILYPIFEILYFNILYIWSPQYAALHFIGSILITAAIHN